MLYFISDLEARTDLYQDSSLSQLMLGYPKCTSEGKFIMKNTFKALTILLACYLLTACGGGGGGSGSGSGGSDSSSS